MRNRRIKLANRRITLAKTLSKFKILHWSRQTKDKLCKSGPNYLQKDQIYLLNMPRSQQEAFIDQPWAALCLPSAPGY